MSKTHDIIIVGAGPAALTAAIYTTREDIDTLLFERGVVGGLARRRGGLGPCLLAAGILLASGLPSTNQYDSRSRRVGAGERQP